MILVQGCFALCVLSLSHSVLADSQKAFRWKMARMQAGKPPSQQEMNEAYLFRLERDLMPVHASAWREGFWQLRFVICRKHKIELRSWRWIPDMQVESKAKCFLNQVAKYLGTMKSPPSFIISSKYLPRKEERHTIYEIFSEAALPHASNEIFILPHVLVKHFCLVLMGTKDTVSLLWNTSRREEALARTRGH